MKKSKLWIILILTIAFVSRIYFLNTTENYYNEEAPAYVRDAMRIAATGHFPIWHNHPGGYQYVLAFLLFLFKPLFSAVLLSQLFNVVLGMISIYYYILLCKKLFGKMNAIVSGMTLSLSIQHIMLSINTLSYGPMYFGLILGLEVPFPCSFERLYL